MGIFGLVGICIGIGISQQSDRKFAFVADVGPATTMSDVAPLRDPMASPGPGRLAPSSTLPASDVANLDDFDFDQDEGVGTMDELMETPPPPIPFHGATSEAAARWAETRKRLGIPSVSEHLKAEAEKQNLLAAAQANQDRLIVIMVEL